MNMLKMVQALSLVTIASVASFEPARATTRIEGSCTWCDDGETCPADLSTFTVKCISEGCGPLPGCVDNWGNCQGGRRVACNEIV
jgi:hypothetical protein